MATTRGHRDIALAIGDTAGHAYPALAVAEAFRARAADTRVLFLATADSIAAGILARAGERVAAVPGAPLRRVGTGARVRATLTTVHAIATARSILARESCGIVLGFGGFATGGVLLAARSLGLATALHEANVEPGLANSWLRRVVHRTYLAHDGALPGGITIGMPVRAAIASLHQVQRAPPEGALRVLVTTGSRGAGFLTAVLPDVMHRVIASGVPVELTQQIGDDAPPDLAQRLREAGVSATLSTFLSDMPEAYRWAHVAITRGGANTLAELAAAGIPAAVIPLGDAAADHQTANARRWAEAGAGPSLGERDWSGDPLVEWLRTMATARDRWRMAAHAARGRARPDAARLLVDDCRTLMERA